MKANLIHIFVLCSITMLSCGVQKYIPSGEKLYGGAEITMQSDSMIYHEKRLKSDLNKVLEPEPNKKLLGVYWGLLAHYKVKAGKSGFLFNYLNKKIGEEPVYISEVEEEKVKDLINNRLENRGYFNSNISFDIKEKRKKVCIDYHAILFDPMRMETFKLDSMPPTILNAIQASNQNTTLHVGDILNLENLSKERKRISVNLKNQGFYNFNDDFLVFEADTSQYNNNKFDLFLNLKEETHPSHIVPYRISRINVYSNHKFKHPIDVPPIRWGEKNYYQKEIFFNPTKLDPYITLQEGDLFNPNSSRLTANRISSTGAYKFVNIVYQPVDSLLTDSLGYLNVNMYLSPLNRQSMRAELKYVTKSNNFSGPTIELTYSNKNVFGGGETFDNSINVGFETQIGGAEVQGKSILEIGLRSELKFPRILVPFKLGNEQFKYSVPKTKISLDIEYFKRTQLYTLLSTTALFGYLWNSSQRSTNEFNPLTFSYTRLSNVTEEFEEVLESNAFLKSSFEQEVISGLYYSFTHNGLVNSQKKNKLYFKSTFELSGNALNLLGKRNNQDSIKTFLGLNFAQYAKIDFDFSFHRNFGKGNLLATRVFLGYGHAYGNSEIVPYVKQYYSGGPYGIRAFNIRSLGPGSYNDSTSDMFFDKTGNIRLETNIEYRFPIVSVLKGALFLDAGNIWNSEGHEAYNYLDGFTSNFWRELGIGVGIGLRIDVSNFVFRFDLASPVNKPYLPQGERFDFDLSESILNFAIGYPF